ncbi:MAG: transcriptional repressor [Verrucomicrobia bacterium]|nr:transcriptional repressor [Verrucomicrobiota bacterium]
MPAKSPRSGHAHAHDHTPDHGCGHTSLSFEQLVESVRRGGLRMTDSRRAILRTLLAARAPLTLEEIRDRSQHDGQPPDFATVFRTMEKLEELRLVHRVNLERASSYFELLDPSSHHEHLVCVGCGLVKPITDECPVEKMERALARKHGFTEIRHSLEFFGRCPDCSAK